MDGSATGPEHNDKNGTSGSSCCAGKHHTHRFPETHAGEVQTSMGSTAMDTIPVYKPLIDQNAFQAAHDALGKVLEKPGR
ncbi:hypothetical protein [Desulfocurvus vexinensis]|uniref:hypothetical protein n=1 Tax=Desulfocurvus vexinensis TaxID=399548 RepID=UPI0012EC1CE1|nr:hypothetical protein [Desulfocurvus vexinensis]